MTEAKNHRLTLSHKSVGVALVVCGTAAFAVNVIVAPFIYANGSDPLTLIFFRSLSICILLGIALAILRHPIRLPARELMFCAAIGVLMTAQTLAFFTAISRIPVSIGTLIEYTYPFQVAIVARLLYGEALTASRLLLMIGALIGLMMVIEIAAPHSDLDTFGVVLMVVASVLLTAKIMTTHRVLLRFDSRRISLYLSTTVALVCGIVFLISPLEPDWPDTESGWWLLCATPVSSLAGMLCFYTGLARIGPASTAMLANCEPVFILLLAILLLGESFNTLQSVGASLVLLCVILFQTSRGK